LAYRRWKRRGSCSTWEERGLIQQDPFINAIGAYHLTPSGLALAEGLPSLDRVLAAQTDVIVKAERRTDGDKKTAMTTMREAFLKTAVERGIDWVIDNWQTLYSSVRLQFPWLPPVA